MAKKSKGRQKIEMTRMSKESNLLVTFSKRRSGLFKKASELCTLCGAEIAIVVFSPGKKAFSFGHPSVEAIADRFLYKNSMHGSSSNATSHLVDAHRNNGVRELNLQLTEAMNLLEIEKKRGDDLNKTRKKKQNQDRCWWEAPVDEMSIEELKQLKLAMEELKKNISNQAEKLHMLEPPNSSYANTSANMSFYGMGLSPALNGPVGQIADLQAPGLGISMAPQGYARGYGYGQANGNGRGFF